MIQLQVDITGVTNETRSKLLKLKSECANETFSTNPTNQDSK